MLINVAGKLVVDVNMRPSRGEPGCGRGPIGFDDSDINRAVATAVAGATLIAET